MAATWRGGRGSRGPALADGAVGAVALVLAVAAATGCGDGTAEARETDRPPVLAVFVYDRSGSVTDHQLELARRLTAERVLALDHGDRIVGMELLEASLAEPVRRWSQQVPARQNPGLRTPGDSAARIRFLRDARDYMRTFTDTATRNPRRGTDVLSTLHDVAADLRAHPDHRAVLYLFSDMLQANREMNFERPGGRPETGWVGRASEEGKLPDLGGLCVAVVGARVDTDRGQAVKAFWREYFEATGAVLRERDYTLRPVRLPEGPCGGP